MNILWLDETCRHNRYDDWLHWKFAKYIKNYANVFFYSPFIHEREPKFTPIHYEKKIRLQDIVDKLEIDAVILDTKASAFHNYLPDTLYHDKHSGSKYWLPEDFKECKVPKFCIEEDFQYETTDNWHKEHGFRAIFQKHFSQATRLGMNLPVHFLPFSIDPTVFKQVKTQRQERVGFAGTMGTGNAMSGGSVYSPREAAYNTLFHNNLLARKTSPVGERIEGQDYVDYLQEYKAYLSCGSVYDLTPAKMFEIMASGGILVTNQVKGLDELFPKGSYIVYDPKTDGIVSSMKKLFSDRDYYENMLKLSLDCIKERHTHDVRIKYMLELIGMYV